MSCTDDTELYGYVLSLSDWARCFSSRCGCHADELTWGCPYSSRRPLHVEWWGIGHMVRLGYSLGSIHLIVRAYYGLLIDLSCTIVNAHAHQSSTAWLRGLETATNNTLGSMRRTGPSMAWQRERERERWMEQPIWEQVASHRGRVRNHRCSIAAWLGGSALASTTHFSGDACQCVLVKSQIIAIQKHLQP